MTKGIFKELQRQAKSFKEGLEKQFEIKEKKFDGDTFDRYGRFDTKKKAKEIAEDIRNSMDNAKARTIEENDKWSVYRNLENVDSDLKFFG